MFLLGSGLRRSEAAALVWGDVRLNSPKPFLQLRAKATKARRADAIPLRSDLVVMFREIRGEAGEGDKVFAAIPTMKEHRAYLTAAGIAWEDEQGRPADVNAMRHSFGTLLSKAGVSPRQAMALMRHTDIALTMRTYTDPRLFDIAGAIELLPGLVTPVQSETNVATGTGGVCVPVRVKTRDTPGRE